MTELKPYPEYKDSGIEWMGKVPTDWEKHKVSRIFKSISSGSTPKSDNRAYYEGGNISWINTGDLNDDFLYNTKNKITEIALEENSALKIYPKNSLVIAMYGATIGKLAITKIPATTNQACCVLNEPINLDIKFMYYWFLTSREDIIHLASGGGQPNISQNLIRNLFVYLPKSKVEQKKIVAFLDGKIKKVNSLISNKKQLIQLLEEKRQAIITETVTKGLDPNVKMKDSGIEWIGEIPEHWVLIKLKYLMKLNPPKSEVMNVENLDVTFIPMENLLSNGKVDYSITTSIDAVYNGYTYFRNNDIIMAKVTPCFENGNIALVRDLKNGLGFGTTELHVLRPNEKIKNEFLLYLLQTEYFKQEGVSTMYGVGGLKRIPSQFILDYKIGLPDIEEQGEILNYIKNISRDVDTIIIKQKIIIEKLKEYRESLIYEAVTGKIDLRDYKADLFDDNVYEQVAESAASYEK